MGRYHAPQVDDDDEQETIPMDWNVIPDDAEGNYVVVSNVTRMGRRDDDDDNDDDDIEDYHGSQRQSLTWYNTATHNDQRDERNHYLLEQQQNFMLETKRSVAARRTIAIIVMAIISMVLKRYAPPPPPVLNQFLFETSKLSTDYTIDTTTEYYEDRHLPDQSIHGNASGMIGVTHHETWASYSRHLICLMYHAMTYVSSVAWYALSYSFRYAWDELKDVCFDFWRSDNARDENLLRTYPKIKELISIIASFWHHMKQSIKMDEGNSHVMTDMQNHNDHYINSERPICMHAAPDNRSDRCITTRRDDTCTSESNVVGSFTTEDYLRQMIGTSLPPQNLALKIISERIDTWGLLCAERDIASASSGHGFIDEATMSQLILPPAIGFLLVGPEGVGKMHVARRLAHYLLAGHCSDATLSRGVLEVLAAAGDIERALSMKELIVNHIHRREGLGSVIIIHHIESMPVSVVTDIAHVLSGKHHSLSYQTPDNLIEASCNGTVFLMTSRQWGTKSIFQVIKQNGRSNRLSRESLIKSISWELEDSHLDHLSKLTSHTTIAPVLPFQQEDLSSMLHSRVQSLNLKYQGVLWKRLDVSLAAIRFFVGSDHVEYSDLFDGNGRHAEINENEKTGVAAASFAFSTHGAHALDRNALLEAIQSMSIVGISRPGSTLKIGVDEFRKETTNWCDTTNGSESCDAEWRSFLA
ncbi:hypothetical protein ACHAW5_001890 [Stephanodiscus triporus]|uniref:ATPase AAA-type core domain-containing protein n=1 Tax=Stephanodiscus triporus TaxID=2934178 RepID=A0ABD3N008_9STRA